MKKILLILVMFSSGMFIYAQKINVESLRKDVYVLAADSLRGRKTGAIEGLMAASYIRTRFNDAGLELYQKKGFQPFQVNTDVKLGERNEFKINNVDAVLKTDFLPFAFSENGNFESGVVFAGYGFDINTDSLKWNDYNGIDVKGKWVLILKGDPEFDKSDSKFIPYTDDRSKVLAAKDKGAAGVILVAGKIIDKKDSLPEMYFDKSDARAGVFAVNVTRKLANKMLTSKSITIDSLEAKLNRERMPYSFDINAKLMATIQVSLVQAMAQNVIGILPGTDPVLKDEYIVVGAHYDHLGMGGHGSGSRNPDTVAVHNGADDNASGTAGLIAIAAALKDAGVKLKRSVIFVAFSGEEMGLLGSKYYTKHSPVELAKTKAMINLDMVGRLVPDSGSVVISGTGTSAEAEEILNTIGKNRPFQLKYSPEGFGASDHSSFYVENIPVFFFTTGAHGDYHTPLDDADLINYEGERDVLAMVYDVLVDIANREKNLTFKEAGPKSASRMGQRFKVTLGILPDFTSSGNEGLRIDGLTKDKPASRAGLLKGDVITAINGKPVKNIYEYMDRLKTLQAGQTCNVDITRNGKTIVVLIQL
jgi:aminopeptidase YwaD